MARAPVIDVDLQTDVKQARIYFEAIEKKGFDRALPRALNKTATAVRKTTANDLQQRRAIPKRQITGAMRIIRANRFRSTAYIAVSGRPIPMRHFASAAARAGKVKRGVTIRIEKGQKRRLLERQGKKAFINAAWNPNVFVRLGYPMKSKPNREAIGKWTPVPGLPRVLVQGRVVKNFRRVAARVFPKRFHEEINFEILRAERKAKSYKPKA